MSSSNRSLTLIQAMQMFSDDEKAEAWFTRNRWRNGVRCAHCGSPEISERRSRKPMPYHCRKCRKYFSVRTNTVMAHSNIPLSRWAVGFYLMTTRPKGVSSIQLSKDLGITQKTAWFMAHRIRAALASVNAKRAGPVEVDETYVGGKFRNRPLHKRYYQGRGAVGKTPVIGMRDRKTNLITAQVIRSTDRRTLRGFVLRNTRPNAAVYTDEHGSYKGMPRYHRTVKHSVREYVRRQVHTNGIESFWAMLKRGFMGTYHKMSAKHLQLYVDEFAWRHNVRSVPTALKLIALFAGCVGKRLTYDQLVRPSLNHQFRLV